MSETRTTRSGRRRGSRLASATLLFGSVLLSCHAASSGGGATDAPEAASAAASTAASASAASREMEADAAAPMDAREAELWQRAAGGEGDDLARLADSLGCAGLVERGVADASLRPSAVRAAAYCRGFVALPWLAEVGQDGPDGDALAALDSAVQLAAEPRRAVDPEDAPELREGCDRLLALARDGARPKDRRIVAIRALRMLVDRGCVDRAAIPRDLDARP